MSKELIGAWSGKPLVAGECNLCGNQGLGNMGLWLCDLHVKVIVREHAPQLLLAHTEAIAKAVEEVKIREDFTPFDDKQRNEVEIYNRGVSDSLQAMAELSEMCAKRARGEASE